MKLHRHESGPRDEADRGSVVFIHGFPFDGSMWAPQLEALPAGWRGLAPDLRGFGGSPLDGSGRLSTGKKVGGRIARGDEPVLTMARLADDVAELIEAEVDGHAVLCGLSMGGYVALALLRRRPDLVRGLVLADTRASADSDEARENRMRMAQIARTAGTKPIADEMLPSLLADTTLDGAPDIVDTVRSMILDTPAPTVVAALAGMASRHDSTSALSAIAVPTLVVVGEHDTITPVDDARDMAAAIPDARLEIVPGAGHLSNLENPRAFNSALEAFLAEL